jgi:hypothetical protein
VASLPPTGDTSTTSATSRPHTALPSEGRSTSRAAIQGASGVQSESPTVMYTWPGSTGSPNVAFLQAMSFGASAMQCCAVSTRFGASSVLEQVRFT